jgi:hypothetical protein
MVSRWGWSNAKCIGCGRVVPCGDAWPDGWKYLVPTGEACPRCAPRLLDAGGRAKREEE